MLVCFCFPDNQMGGLVRLLGELPSRSYYGKARWYCDVCIYGEQEEEENVDVTLTEPDLAMG